MFQEKAHLINSFIENSPLYKDMSKISKGKLLKSQE